MRIAYAIAKIAERLGSTAAYDNRVTISKACDMLGEALAGEGIDTPHNVGEAIEAIGQYIEKG